MKKNGDDYKKAIETVEAAKKKLEENNGEKISIKNVRFIISREDRSLIKKIKHDILREERREKK